MFRTRKLTFIIVFILFFLPLILQLSIFTNSDDKAYGFPLSFIQRVTYQCVVGSLCPEPFYSFKIFPLILDFIILYLVTVLIMFVYKRYERKLKNIYLRLFFLTLILFVIFTIISLIFQSNSPFKGMIGVGLPISFYTYSSWEVSSIFLWKFFFIDIIYWFILSVLIILAYKRFGKS